MPDFFRSIRLFLVRKGLGVIGEHRRRVLSWRLIEASDLRCVTFERVGIVWNVAPADDVGVGLYLGGGYHHEQIDALIGWMRHHNLLTERRNVLVDVGANIGTTCIPFVRATGCRALAIEPVADTFYRLRSNVKANALSEEVLLMKRAVQKAPGRVRMGQVRGASGGSFVWREGSRDLPPNASAEYEEVEADGLLAIIEAAGLRADAVALVWADVQGCESAVIETSAPLWDGGVPLWAEVEPRSLQRQGALASFAALAANYFDRFIPSRELVRYGPHATARPIGELPALIRGIGAQVNTDVLFLPPRFRAAGLRGT